MSLLDSLPVEPIEADLWQIERDYRPLPSIPCRCRRPLLEPWGWGPKGSRCVKCGHDALDGAGEC